MCRTVALEEQDYTSLIYAKHKRTQLLKITSIHLMIAILGFNWDLEYRTEARRMR